jgi:hypothetical protein
MTSQFSGGPGFLAFVVTFGLVVAGVILFRSLSAHLRKVRTHPPQDELNDAESGVGEDDEGTRDEVADEPGDR